MNLLKETLISKLVYLIMSQKLIRKISYIDVSNYALKSNLASLKTEVDKLDIDKLMSVLIDLAKLSNAVKNDVAKKTEYDELVNKVNSIDNK